MVPAGGAGTPRLEADADAAPAGRAAVGSSNDWAQIVEANLRLVVAVARSYCPEGGPRLLELIQEGNLGLIEAVDRYDTTRGSRFASYASWCIRGRILEAPDGDRHLRARRAAHETRRAAPLRTALEREPTFEEVGLEVGRPAMQAQELLASTPGPASLDAPLTPESRSRTFSCAATSRMRWSTWHRDPVRWWHCGTAWAAGHHGRWRGRGPAPGEPRASASAPAGGIAQLRRGSKGLRSYAH